ncbi:hypothetical protein BCON_0045g00020 [Botryotinia convoluta]|uniref:Heterokaryon incompatibility domain-containing protein n=1 Tax=Botryotinia convoluta TaxID=54673 RepID=A0A4Z1ICI3_9HELO|nr:hypothetical protein BCON_0045g00020 [Botryotinia convoluta]
MPPLSYASLPPLDLSTIRLLSLMSNRDETAALQGQLHNYSLQESDKETHLYEALSYVDTLCINQQDDQEKGLQIQLMPRIYGQATRVIVYFGEAADDSDMALESIRVAADDENEKPRNLLAIKRNQDIEEHQLPQIEINSVVPDYLKTNAIKAMRSFEVALILKDTGDHTMAEAKLKKDIEKCEELFGIDDIHILSLQEALVQDLQGNCHQDTLNSKMKLAKAYIDEEVISRPSRAEQSRGFRTELLEAIKSNSRIEERIMVLAVGYLDERMFKLLLGLERDNVSVTKNLVKAISRRMRDDGKMAILLEERGMDSKITEEMVQFIVKNCGRNAMKLLIQKRGADVKVTTELLKEVAKRWEAFEQIELLFDGRGADICIDNGLLTTLARMDYPDIPAIMDLILEEQGTNIAITEETVIAAVGNENQGGTIIKELFAKQGTNIVITDEIVIAAVGNIYWRAGIIRLLLKKRGADINITPEIMKAVLKNQEKIRDSGWRLVSDKDIMMQLLEKRGAYMEVTEETVRMITNEMEFSKQCLALLIIKQGEKLRVTEEMVRIVEEKLPEEGALLEMMKDNIQKYSSGSTSSIG